MILTKEKQKETGAFYTPKKWADLAVEEIKGWLKAYRYGFDFELEDFIFWDVAAGEGSLLESLPESVEKLATTLENEDVEILKTKGFEAYQFDFLEDDLSYILEKIKKKNKPIIIFTNPPYFKLKANHDCYAKTKYNNSDSVALFYYRIFKEINPFLVCSFNKLDLLQSRKLMDVREDLNLWEKHLFTFLTNSNTWNLKGSFPIAFQIYYPNLFINQNIDNFIIGMVHEKNNVISKKIYRYD